MRPYLVLTVVRQVGTAPYHSVRYACLPVTRD